MSINQDRDKKNADDFKQDCLIIFLAGTCWRGQCSHKNENEDQDFLICVKSEKVYGSIWEEQIKEEIMETKKAWSLKIMKLSSAYLFRRQIRRKLFKNESPEMFQTLT